MSAAIQLDDDGAIYGDDNGVAADSPMTPRDLFKHLRKTVIGQDRALRSFSVAAWRHSMGLRQGAILISGPTGTGKTMLAKAYAKFCELPFIIVNSTGIVADGIKGQSWGDIFTGLYNVAHKNYSKARVGIVILDEADKLEANFYFSSIQASLLSILDGTAWRSFDSEKKPPFPNGCFETDRLLVIFLGSYTDIRQQRGQRVGFGADHSSSLSDIPLDELIALNDLRGRISTHVEIQPHTKKSLMMILNAEDGPMQPLRDSIPQWYLTLANETKDRLVNETLAKGLGARYLWTRLAAISEELVFAPPEEPGEYGGIIVQQRAA